MSGAGLFALDNGCRGAAAGLLLMMTAVFLRQRPVEFIRAALAAAGAASAIIDAPGLPSEWHWARLPLIALSSSGSVAFWLWARLVFDDDFVFRPWHRDVWIALVSLTLIASYGIIAGSAASAISWILTLANLSFGLLAVMQTIASWRMDLVAGRRRLRVAVLMGTLAYIAVNAIANLSSVAILTWSAPVRNLANGLGLCLLAALAGWSVFRTASPDQAVPPEWTAASVDRLSSAPIETEGGRGIEPTLLNRLQRLMTAERIYRREGLTIGSLAALMSLPEYRLRQIINEGLGYRNFNAFLNRYRIDEAKAALADPNQKDVSILTIAMDAGFQSLGPFNRAFKAETGLTPTEFRRQILTQPTAKQQDAARNFTIGKPR
ncbi:helix-turn-helix domain-containing protein [Rhizobium multihospitium]|uniref:Transcriptional regulator, AraC family n=1 Tax=Rhizobium multihospitium TaxID=410764 RepID=A0A1C3UIH9_9HYPH|nr:helix-turn-helix domain-containing protein [Rhizobium multihospitium]SCB15303.1 transcriptional regulator, AraC family [Rhizobium multihospitium]